MVQTTVFKSNTSQAVRLPKAVEFPSGVKKVDVVAIGNKRVITPAGEMWDDWFELLHAAPDAGLNRDQPEHQHREVLDA
ncbi:MAG: antitoxin [Anaerolineae bacterium]|nr:antitoxin [Anaerolineae bacterium]